MLKNLRPYNIIEHKEYKIGRFSVVKDKINTGQGVFPYSYVKEKDCVCILPFCAGDIILIQQYRHSLNQWCYEIPAGGIEQGENIIQAARRELFEETGYMAETVQSLGVFPVSNGTSTAKAYLFVAECKKKEPQCLDPTEYIYVERKSEGEFENMMKTGKFAHMVGIVAWHIYKYN